MFIIAFLVLVHYEIYWNKDSSTLSVNLAKALLSWKITRTGFA